MIDFCILGSGLSGSTIANLLHKKYLVEIIDKAKGVGGRSSNKKVNKFHGCLISNEIKVLFR